MSETMESIDNAEEDSVSVHSNGKTPTKDASKKIGKIKSIRQSFRHVMEKNPLSPGSKGSKGTFKADSVGNDSESPDSPPPPSPSLSTTSAVSSPQNNTGTLLQKTEEDETDVGSQKMKSPKTEPSLPKFGDTLRASFRHSVRLVSKKVKEKTNINSPQSSLDEKNEEVEEQEETKVEMEETYTLPDIPHTPLSVMEINKLIETEMLETAHLHLLSMRQEFQREQDQCGEDSSVELAKKEKDLILLYGELRTKIISIVCNSKELPVARIIQEEEKRAEEPGGLPGSWMEVWRTAVGQGVQMKVGSVPLEQSDQNISWLAVHLGLLGKAIVEDLENVKRELRWSYPPSFKVFSTYVQSYHRVIREHLKKLEQKATELKDLYALLDWIINTYKSERIMDNVSLQPDIKDESTDLQLEENFLKQLKEKYCCQVKEKLKSSLNGIIKLENEEIWQKSKSPKKEDGVLLSELPMDIWTAVKSNVLNSRKIDAQLEQSVISSCLQELKLFPKSFETEFKQHCSTVEPEPLWAEYHITYINSFTALQEHMEGYSNACPEEVKGFREEVTGLINRLMKVLEDQFKEDVKPYLRRMITRKWLTNDDDFNQLYSRTSLLSQHCVVMKRPRVQEFANHLHYHVVKEYVNQLMKNNYSCKNRKHEKAATKIRQQLGKLEELFENMNSTQEWLYPVGDDLSEIIGQKNKGDIKLHLERLVQDYPDFRRKHLVAVLNFRGLIRGREHHRILQRFTELSKEPGKERIDRDRVLFRDMEVTVNTDCLSNLPLSCLRILPDS